MYVNDAAAKRNHVGRARLLEGCIPLESSRNDFMASRDILEGIRTAIRAASDEEQFQRLVAQLRQAKTARITGNDPALVLQNAARDFGLTGAEQPGILRRLSESNDLTQYGLANAVALHSQDVASYDRATELEGVGYQIMTMPPVQWTRINQAA